MTTARALVAASAEPVRASTPRSPPGRRSVPAWVLVLAGYAASRVLSTGILAAAFAISLGVGAPIAHANVGSGFLGFLQSWDGAHYRHIAEHGYPQRLPVDALGNVQRNSWAFLPLYPYLVRGLTLATGLDFSIASIIVSVLFGGAATVAIHRLLLPRFGATGALWGAIFFCFGPMSYLLQVAYADSVFLFLMFCSLICMMSRRWLLMSAFAVAASFAHPGAIALALAVGLVCLVRLIRRDPTFALREKLAAGFAIAVITVAGFAWPVIAGLVTRDPSAYFDSETAWWTGYIGQTNFIPFSPWFILSAHYWGVIGIIGLGIILGSFVFWMTRRSTKRYGEDLLAYTGSYAAYLVAVFLPQQSIVRMLLPLSPLLGHPGLWSSRRRRAITLAVSVFWQPIAVVFLWIVYPP
jgi:hypothetical protein